MAKPTTTTMYYLKQKDFKFDETIDSVLVLISDRCDTIVSIYNGELIIENEQFSIYPNPANDKLYIKTKSNVRSMNIEVYDTYGQLILHSPFSILHSIATLNINHLDSGIYFIKINSVTKRFVKM